MEVESTRQNRDMKLRYREKQTENSVAYLEQTIWRFAVEQFAEQGHFIKLLNPIFSFRNREPFVNEKEGVGCRVFCMFPGRGKGQASGFDDVDPMISRHLSTGLTCVFSVTDEPAFISQAHLVVNEARPVDINESGINEKEIKREWDGPLVRAVRARPVGDVAAREWAMESVTCAAVVLLENSEIEIKIKSSMAMPMAMAKP
ncbi:hypothetical protein F2Q68_00007910 [Brassica cretica]|uniref:Uncharacterized protein n=1 Tax=Brassica cretica TaxID=69181 RepID=A0A8S9KT18_BRACR|nr:hypothetical protein F2Q68_00007910 [Brassica cretica]